MLRTTLSASSRSLRGAASALLSTHASPGQTSLGGGRIGAGGRSSRSGLRATVFGATGFLGSYLVNALGQTGGTVYIPFRGDDMEWRHLKLLGDLGQVQGVPYSVRDADSYALPVSRSNVVVNLIGKHYATRGLGYKINFSLQDVHVTAARQLAAAAREAGVERFIHVSALGASHDSPSEFMRTKAEGEAAVLEEFPSAVIIRPATMFGMEDRFINWIASVADVMPRFPVVNAGSALLQPVFVNDVARGVHAAALAAGEAVEGRTFELAGPNVYSWRETIEICMDRLGRDAELVDLPLQVVDAMARALQMLPNPQLTQDQVLRMTEDAVATGAEPGLAELGIVPIPLRRVLSEYLGTHRSKDYLEEYY